jgi:hypothetical protein
VARPKFFCAGVSVGRADAEQDALTSIVRAQRHAAA